MNSMDSANANSIPVPGGKIVRRKLPLFWIFDHSGSMEGTKIAALNQAMREVIPVLREALKSHPQIDMQVRVIRFSDKAKWHIGPDAVSIDQLVWTDLKPEGTTATAEALELLAGELEMEKIGRRAVPPVCILLSDGYCTDSDEAYRSAIEKLNNMPWGKKAIRLAIAVGKETDYDEAALLQFVNQKEIGLLSADSIEKVKEYIKWVSTTASIHSADSKMDDSADPQSNVVLSRQLPIVDVNTPF